MSWLPLPSLTFFPFWRLATKRREKNTEKGAKSSFSLYQPERRKKIKIY